MRVIFSILFLFFSTVAYPVYFRHLGVEDGLPHASVLSIYQDVLGRMWFGTQEGLGIYDGKSFQSFKVSASSDTNPASSPIAGNKITPITGDKEGNVFFLADQALMRYDLKKERFDVVRKSGMRALTSYQGKIWCVANDSMFVYDDVSRTLNFRLKTNLENVRGLFILKEGEYWIGTRKGLFAANKSGALRCLIPDIWIFSFLRTSKGEIWVSSLRDGLFRVDPDGSVKRVPYSFGPVTGVASNWVRQLVEDNTGNIWFGTFKGLQKYNPYTGEFTLYENTDHPGALSHSSVYGVYKDRRGTIWAGTYYGGVNYFNPEKDLFTFYPYGKGQKNSLSFPFVGNMAEDKEGNLWICTEGGGLNCLDRKKGTLTSYPLAPLSGSLTYDNLKSICYNRERDCLYLGAHNGGLLRFDIRTRSFKQYPHPSVPDGDAPDDIINKAMLYKEKLVIAARNGLFVMDTRTERFHRVRGINPSLTFDIDREGTVWLLWGKGVTALDLETETKQRDFLIPRCATSGTHVLCGDDGFVYVGSFGCGLFRLDKKSGEFTGYTAASHHFLSDYCYNLVQTRSGELLVTTDKGLMFFSPSGGLPDIISLGTGIPLTSLMDGCGLYVCRDNEIFVGGTNGLMSFWQDEVANYAGDYNFYFSGLQVNNKKVYPDDPTGILDRTLAQTDRIELAYKQNNLIFTFASSDYADMLKNTGYEYKLEGFDAGWIPARSSTLHYTNLHPGNYRLKVRALMLHSTDVPREISLALTIRTPWYNTAGAWIIYLLAASLIIYTIWESKKARLELALSLREERNEKIRIEELNQSKLRFFTNISHEFRTPLTLILSHLDIVLQTGSLSPTVYNKLRKIHKHTYRMRNLITELLDFRKFDQQQVSLKVSEQDLVPFLKEIYLSFTDYAAEKEISYHFQSASEKLPLWFDPRQMQKVFFNLLSNAFKYTPDGRHIEVVVSEEDSQAVIKIIDTGTGLSATDKEHIFERFYQAENAGAGTVNPGTGIGLALTENIVRLHQGEIRVESRLGYGSIFSVFLKKGYEHFMEKENVEICMERFEPGVKIESLPEPVLEEKEEEAVSDAELADEWTSSRYTVLLVEDNEELIQVLISLFSPLYNVISAFNGEEGLKKVADEQPDLIVSDVMMPVMSGTEMCLRIKNDIDLCHIPVILLSALNSDEQNVEGLQCGADDYVGKPFNAKILLLRCNNQLRNRQNLQNKLAKQENFDIGLLATNALDKEFLDKITALLEKYLDDPDFDINRLAQEMGMGRSSFFTKFKSLTGVTPASFVQDYKLKKVAEWLVSYPNMRVSEISDKLGFGTPHYMGKCFKTKYNLSPFEFRKQKIASI